MIQTGVNIREVFVQLSVAALVAMPADLPADVRERLKAAKADYPAAAADAGAAESRAGEGSTAAVATPPPAKTALEAFRAIDAAFAPPAAPSSVSADPYAEIAREPAASASPAIGQAGEC